MNGVVISSRFKFAIRAVGEALGFDLELLENLAKSHRHRDGREVHGERLQDLGLSLVVLGGLKRGSYGS